MRGRDFGGGVRRSIAVASAWAAMAGLVGCEAPSFVPPPGPPPVPPASVAPAAAQGVVLVLPADDTPLTRAWEQAVRQEAGLQKLAFRSERPGPDVTQAEIVRAAKGRGAGALIVVADDPEAVAPAAAEAIAAGLGVVQLVRPIPGLDGKTTLIAPPKLEEAARKVVAATLEDARTLGIEPGSAAAIFVRRPGNDRSAGDARTDERVEALRRAATEAGLGRVVEVPFEGGPPEGIEAVNRVREAEPEITVFLAEEDAGVRAIAEARGELNPPGRFVSGGYFVSPPTADYLQLGHASGLADLDPVALARRAVQAAADLLAGRPVPEVIETEPRFLRGNGQPPAPGPGAMRKQQERSHGPGDGHDHG